ncbi:DNA mismatch repair protein MutT [Erythrobacter litoralis]|uniref:DNA mismatch repair protein MutT n=1 Tax=Erythrobacter litoralis TaxID=39960 RepID=A0A074N2U6_9SPHN|nr:NUDIX domain-containing protein [Erythrobacter litoralis]KEO99135.1 DNA mismatch repair protein MutT [Erythrobacter litoralis]
MSEAASEKRLRRSARLIVLAPGPRVLMFRYDIPGRAPFWVTAGGECEPGESFEDAARRELFEETGIVADPGEQIARTTPEFVTPEGEPVRADERYFIVHVTEPAIDTSRHTALEQAWMNEHRWFALEELGDWPEALYPETLRSLIKENLP